MSHGRWRCVFQAPAASSPLCWRRRRAGLTVKLLLSLFLFFHTVLRTNGGGASDGHTKNKRPLLALPPRHSPYISALRRRRGARDEQVDAGEGGGGGRAGRGRGLGHCFSIAWALFWTVRGSPQGGDDRRQRARGGCYEDWCTRQSMHGDRPSHGGHGRTKRQSARRRGKRAESTSVNPSMAHTSFPGACLHPLAASGTAPRTPDPVRRRPGLQHKSTRLPLPNLPPTPVPACPPSHSCARLCWVCARPASAAGRPRPPATVGAATLAGPWPPAVLRETVQNRLCRRGEKACPSRPACCRPTGAR
jgi:hypothetical protein